LKRGEYLSIYCFKILFYYFFFVFITREKIVNQETFVIANEARAADARAVDSDTIVDE
jgi:hypothetical protein